MQYLQRRVTRPFSKHGNGHWHRMSVPSSMTWPQGTILPRNTPRLSIFIVLWSCILGARCTEMIISPPRLLHPFGRMSLICFLGPPRNCYTYQMTCLLIAGASMLEVGIIIVHLVLVLLLVYYGHRDGCCTTCPPLSSFFLTSILM